MARRKQHFTTRSKRSQNADAAASSNRLGFNDYLMLNLVFFAFCIIQLIIVRLLLPDFAGLYFFFGFLMCAFSVASVFDFLCEKLDVGAPAEEKV